MGLGGKVAIIGTGTIKFGENFHQSLTDMIYEAVTLALADAGLERGRLQAAWLRCYEPPPPSPPPRAPSPPPPSRAWGPTAPRGSRRCATPRWPSPRASTTWCWPWG